MGKFVRFVGMGTFPKSMECALCCGRAHRTRREQKAGCGCVLCGSCCQQLVLPDRHPMTCIDETYWSRRRRREDEFSALVIMVSELPTDIIVCIISHLDRLRAMVISWSCGSIRRAAMTPSLWTLVNIHDLDECRWIVGIPWQLVHSVIISHGEGEENEMPDVVCKLVMRRPASHVRFKFDGFWILESGMFHILDSRRVTFESLELELDNLVVAREGLNWALISAACSDITIKVYMEEAEYNELDDHELHEWIRTTVADNGALDTLSILVHYSYWDGGRERMMSDWSTYTAG